MSSQLQLPADLVLPPDADVDLVVPRVCHYPVETYDHSVGLDAVDVAESAGLVLDAWQQLTVQLGLGRTAAGRWAAFQVALIVARQNGKGSILECLELYWLFVSNEPLIGHSAHEYKTAMEAFRRVLFHITNTDWMRKKVKKVINTNGEEGIELLTGQRLRFLARSKGAGRGFSFHKLVWDEAYALTGEQVEAQLPTLSAIPDPQVWLTSSPPLDPATGAALFRIRRAVTKGTAKDLAMLDFGAGGSLDKLEDIALDDRETWKRTNPAYGIRISMATIERERASMSDAGFARERLCIWPPDLAEGFTVFSEEQWNALFDRYSGIDTYEKLPTTMEYWPDPSLPISDPRYVNPPTKLVGRPAIALDVSPRVGGAPSRAAIGLAQKRFDGLRHLELIKSGTGTAWIVPDLITMARETNACAIVIDPGSPAGSLLADLEAAIAATATDGLGRKLEPDILVKLGARDVAQAFGMIYDAATGKSEGDRNVRHIGQPELTAEVADAGKRPVGDGHAWDRRTGTPITGIVSVTHALFGLAKNGSTPDVVFPWAVYA